MLKDDPAKKEQKNSPTTTHNAIGNAGRKVSVAGLPLFYAPAIAEGPLTLDGEEARHIRKVLRLKDGDLLGLTNGRGELWVGKIIETSSTQCIVEATHRAQIPPRPYQIHIAIAPTKNADRMEWFVEKATEMGVDRISFIRCARSERTSINLDRLKKKAVSAMKQSQQTWLPAIDSMLTLGHFSAAGTDEFIADMEATRSLGDQAVPGRSYCVLIGPEGGFSEQERREAYERGFQPVSLGKNRLRTETAGIAACQLLNFINR